MSEKTPPRPKPPPPNRHRAPEELARLEAALRSNLKRRRAQKAARADSSPSGPPEQETGEKG